MRPDWKEFNEPAARRIPDAARVSLGARGAITFDLDTYRRLGEPEAMLLLYEESTRSIGLKPAHSDIPHSVLVRSRHPRSNRCVVSMPFLRRHKIDCTRSIRFPFPPIDDGVLVLRLDTAISAERPERKKKR